MRIQPHNARLIRLRYIRENDIDHGNQHPVAEGLSRVFDDGDYICAVRSHVNQIAPRTMREFDCKHGTLGTDDVSDVRY